MPPRIDIKITVRSSLPRIPFERIAREVLATDYQLSLVICGDTLSRRINREYRKKSYAPNVLSFPITKKEGEIFLNMRKAEREARRGGISATKRAALLYVHGLFHLKGLDHSDTMERAEMRVLKKYRLA
jgi:probable rRNA maturation factor